MKTPRYTSIEYSFILGVVAFLWVAITGVSL